MKPRLAPLPEASKPPAYLHRLLDWWGKLPPAVQAEAGDGQSLAALLYQDWYAACPRPTAADRQVEQGPLAGRRDLQSALHAAALGSGRFDDAWVAMSALQDGRLMAAPLHGQAPQRLLGAGEFLNLCRPGVPPAPGEQLAVLNRLSWLDEASGYWATRSPSGEPEHPLLRVYWSVRADSAAALVARLIPVVERLAQPWSIKSPNSVLAYERRDAMVLYLPQPAGERARPALRRLARKQAALLRDVDLPMAAKLAPGVAWAESEQAEESFGQSRCRLLAAALLPLLGKPSLAPDAARRLWPAVQFAFAAQGLDASRPWLAAPVQAAAERLHPLTPPLDQEQAA